MAAAASVEDRGRRNRTMSVPSLNRKHAIVLEEIFGHPLPHNLEWLDVVSLVNHLGSALERPNGNYEFTIGTTSEVFKKPHQKDMEVDDVVRLRTFLKTAGVDASGVKTESPATQAPRKSYVVLLIDHHSARFFEPQSDGVHIAEGGHVEPADPHGFERHLEHRKEAHYQGERVPEPPEYYERVAQRLKGFDSILVLGDASGKSSALHYLVQYLQAKHNDVAVHVVDTVQVDLSSITIDEIQNIKDKILH
jgi:hypothetical protein